MTYALLVAGVGIVTVFLFLTLLSLIMTATTRLLGTETEASAAPGEAAATGRRAATLASPGTSGVAESGPETDGDYDSRTTGGADRREAEPAQTPAWVYAAAAAYLESEERDAVSSAPWVASRRPEGGGTARLEASAPTVGRSISGGAREP
jgi:Na+-transporting methylmalonyl-CoA/oxaloacetate decarboxylase gamma subunit